PRAPLSACSGPFRAMRIRRLMRLSSPSRRPNKPATVRVPLAAAGACTQMPAGTPAEFCTQLSCPPPGTIAGFWVQAIWLQQHSAPSNIVTCWFKPSEVGCPCHDPAEATPPPPAMPPVVSETIPPLPQQGPAGLGLLPVGAILDAPTAPAAP